MYQESKPAKPKSVSCHCYGVIYDPEGRVTIAKRNIVRTRHGDQELTPHHMITGAGQYTFAGGRIDVAAKRERYKEQELTIPDECAIQLFHALEELYNELGIKTLPVDQVGALELVHEETDFFGHIVYVFVSVSGAQLDELVEVANLAIGENQVRDDEIAVVEAVSLAEAFERFTQVAEYSEDQQEQAEPFLHTSGKNANIARQVMGEAAIRLHNGWHLEAIRHVAKLTDASVDVHKIDIAIADQEAGASLKVRALDDVAFAVESDAPSLDIRNEYGLSYLAKLP